jgi:hypothetical protein
MALSEMWCFTAAWAPTAPMYKSRRTIEHKRDTIKQKFHVKTNGELMKAAIAKGYYCIRIFIGLVTHLPFFDEDLITLLA